MSVRAGTRIRPTTLHIADLSKEARDYLAAVNKQLGEDSASYRNALLKWRAEVLEGKDASESFTVEPGRRLELGSHVS
jgi:hypothetical protein